jgi:hypothetical protein
MPEQMIDVPYMGMVPLSQLVMQISGVTDDINQRVTSLNELAGELREQQRNTISLRIRDAGRILDTIMFPPSFPDSVLANFRSAIRNAARVIGVSVPPSVNKKEETLTDSPLFWVAAIVGGGWLAKKYLFK